MALIDGESIDTDLVAVSAPLYRLLHPVMAFFACGLKALVGAPKQIGIAVMRRQVIDHGGAWVCPAASETAAAAGHLTGV